VLPPRGGVAPPGRRDVVWPRSRPRGRAKESSRPRARCGCAGFDALLPAGHGPGHGTLPCSIAPVELRPSRSLADGMEFRSKSDIYSPVALRAAIGSYLVTSHLEHQHARLFMTQNRKNTHALMLDNVASYHSVESPSPRASIGFFLRQRSQSLCS